MSLKKLLKLVPPPKKPIEAGSKAKWAKVEKELGTPLPSDYKEFIDKYGTGVFADIFYVFNPFASQPDHNLLDELKQQREYYTLQRQEDEEEYPYEVYPKKPGLLPWGRDGVSNGYFWLVKPKVKPDDWPAVFYEPRGNGFEESERSFSEYLEGILTGKIKAPMGNYPRKEHLQFQPFEVPAETSPQALSNAIERNDLKEVERLLDAGADPNSEWGNSTTLEFAIALPDLAIAKRLLERGADVNGRPGILFFTAQAGRMDVLKFLLDLGADPNLTSLSGGSALGAAASLAHVRMVSLLLEKGGDPNIRDDKGRTPLFRAAAENSEAGAEVIKMLVAHGAELGVRNNEGQTALDLSKVRNWKISVLALKAAAKAR